MIRIRNEPSSAKWDSWKAKGQRKAAEHIADHRAGREFKIDADLYKACRNEILENFHGKCGYCESLIAVQNHVPDVEHYRPKGRIRDHLNSEDLDKHPGYFWLAYEWRNLLPSCPACNRPGKAIATGKTVGKHDLFPVASGTRAWKPGHETREEPLLLNPYIDDPADHFTFDYDTGVIGAKTDRGEETIRLLDLNRDALLSERVAHVTQARYIVGQLFRELQDLSGLDDRRWNEVLQAKHPEKSYSAFRAAYIDRVIARFQRFRTPAKANSRARHNSEEANRAAQRAVGSRGRKKKASGRN